MDKKRIVVVDDHPIFRAGLIQALELEEEFDVVGQGTSGVEAVSLAQDHRPDMVLLDITMDQSGVEGITKILEASPATSVVMLTASEKADDVARSLELGAVSYVLKGTTARDLLAILHEIFAGSDYISPRLFSGLINRQAAQASTPEQQALAALTAQEARVLRLVSQGMSNSEIARNLAVQEKTVKFHLSNIFTKLAVRNRVQAALLARQEWG